MDEKRRIAVLVRERQVEALRMAVGLTVLGDVVDVYALDIFFQNDEKTAQSLDALKAMGGTVYTNIVENPVRNVSFSDAAIRLMDYDIILPY